MEILEFQLSQIKKTKILICDDLPENLQMLGNTLRDHGFQIAFATGGKQALIIAASKKPDLILLDISMPEMDGLVVCQKLKENPITRKIPVIFLTAKTESQSIMKALSVGAVDYVAKPFNTDDLINRILTHLGITKITKISQWERENYILLNVINELESEYLRKWNELRKSMFINEVIDFGIKLKNLGEENNIQTIVEYGADLFETANSLKIDKMSEKLEQFPNFIQKLKQ